MRWLLIFLVVLTGCAAHKKSYNFSSEKQFDSIYYDSKVVIYPSLRDTVFIDQPCNSTGILKPFKQRYTTSQGNVTIEGKDGKITALIDLKGTTDSKVIEGQVHQDQKAQVKESLTVKYQNDWRLIIALVLSLTLNAYMIFYKRKP